jgi:hypothetical protein
MFLRLWAPNRKSRPIRRSNSADNSLVRLSAFRPGLERLEDRVQPSTVTWVNPAGGDWSNAANWQEQGTGINRVPGAGDDAVIDLGANNFTVTHSANADSIHSLTSKVRLELSGGSLSLAASSTIDALYLNATLITNSDLTVTGPDTFPTPGLGGLRSYGGAPLDAYGFVIYGGTLGGSGTVYLNTTAFLGYTATYLSVPVVNNVLATAGGQDEPLVLGAGASLTNTAGATLQLELGGPITGAGSLVNRAGGTITKLETSGGYDTFNLGVPLDNAGLVDVQGGTLQFGALRNAGTIVGEAGTSLTLAGPFTEQIGGVAAGTQYGQIVDNGSTNLGGGLQAALVNGYEPNLGDTFKILKSSGGNALNGAFAGIPEGGTIAVDGYQFRISYAGGDVTLTTIAVPFHSTTTSLATSANSPLLGDTVTFTATVGTDPRVGTPTGTVQFQVDGSNFGSPVSLVNGVASVATSALSVDAHTVTAVYSGGGGFLTSSGSTNVTVIAPASLSGIVWEDLNNDGQVDFGEKGIPGVQVTLTGPDDLGNTVNLSQTTDADGAYLFLNLRPGNYYITETQPAGYLQGIDSVGTAGGSLAGTDQFLIPLGPGVNGLNYNFGEQPSATGPVHHGQTAGIGFWNNKNGQTLINSLNNGVGTELADWLAATLPNMFGIRAGSNNLSGKNNAAVAALFQQDFLLKGVKLDAQVLATALSVYATNAALDSTGVAANYGFTVSGDGVGTAAVNVGSDGTAFGVANNTVLTVMDLLLATDAQSVSGVLYGGNSTKRNMANDLYSAVNQAGGI